MAQLPRSSVLWVQVVALALVQGAITLMWVIYNLYLPQLLNQFGFAKEFAMNLLLVENLLAVGMEPLMGGLSDNARQWLGSKFPFIAVGVVLSSALFVSLPTIVIFGSPTSGLRWVLPAALVAWALAMTVFRSPALSLLGQYAVETRLPQAVSILIFMGALAGAVGAFANRFILSLGAPVAFVIGSLVLLAAAATLRSTNPKAAVPSTPDVSPQRLSLLNLGLILGTGVSVALGFTLVMRSLLNPATPQPNSPWMLVVFTIVHLLSVVPVGWLATRIGNTIAMLVGVSAMVISLLLLAIVHSTPIAIGVAAIVGIAWSFLFNGTMPFALSLVPLDRAGLGVGMYFGGSSLAGFLFGLGAVRFGTISPVVGVIAAAIAFTLAGLCILTSLKLTKR